MQDLGFRHSLLLGPMQNFLFKLTGVKGIFSLECE